MDQRSNGGDWGDGDDGLSDGLNNGCRACDASADKGGLGVSGERKYAQEGDEDERKGGHCGD